MTARKKKAARKKSARKKAGRRLNLDADMKRYARQFEQSLRRLEKGLDTAEQRYRRTIAGLLRDAGRQVGRLDSMGDKRWRDLIGPASRDLMKLLKRMEKAVAPSPKPKKAAKKKAARKKKAAAS